MARMPITLVNSIETANRGRLVPALRGIAARNLAEKRTRQGGTWQAKARAAAYRPAPGVVIPPPVAGDVPVAFKAERPKHKRVTRPATDTAPVAAEKVYAPILAKDVPADARALVKVHKAAGELSAEWFPIGAMPTGDDRTVCVRLHGASVRYAAAA